MKKKLFSLLLALALSLSMSFGMVAQAGSSVYAFNVLAPDSVTLVDDNDETSNVQYPVCSGLLLYVGNAEEYEEYDSVVRHDFTPGADGSGVYDVEISVDEMSEYGDDGVYMELLFSTLPETPPTITRVSGSGINMYYSGDDHYLDSSTDPSMSYYSHYYWYSLSRGYRSATCSYQVDLPASGGGTVHRTINLTMTRNYNREIPENPADFGALLPGEQTLYSQENDNTFTVYQGILPTDNNMGVSPEQVLSGTVNGYRALAVCNANPLKLALAFEDSQQDKTIGWMLFDSEGQLLWVTSDHNISGELDELENGLPAGLAGYASQDSDICVSAEEEQELPYDGTPYLLLAYNEADVYLPIVMSRVETLGQGESLALPEWQDAWDVILANFDLRGRTASSGGGSGFAAERAEETTFWQELLDKSTAANGGDTVSFDAGYYENIPHWLIDSLAGKDMTLKLTFRDENGVKQTVSINCANVAKTDPNRIFFSVADFAALYQ